ncbi:MAG TPA: asparagine synthase (glutamine-hydrolyzing) [Vicinamibacterales bacterium]|jgi:asparagine synthase (glutamine-hydrolysing)|nr:asparagine synthase (glutamine-hydrolyzing) [Vicinamibacterales bacterium]
MCAIAGAVAAKRAAFDPSLVADMVATLRHRGPDDCGLRAAEGIALGHARLSIIDLPGGRQPMCSGNGSIWIAFNGEIYNFIELRADLVRRGYTFRTRSDTEVLLRLYEADGDGFVQKLNGQWAFAIWDEIRRTLLLSRDRFGVRPLFYTTRRDRLLFASEIKALFVDPSVTRAIDPRGLDNVLTFWTTIPPRTVFKDVHELPPGHSLTWHDGGVTVTPHWQPAFRLDEAASRSDGEWLEELRARLVQATRIRLRSDVPVGAYLSGGLDSSVVTALMREAAGQPSSTFSIAFDEPEFDERVHQQAAVRALGTDHHELRCAHGDIAHVFPEVIWHTEQPLLRTAPAPMFLLSRLVRERGFKVVLTGEGADEVLGGYDIFKEAKIRRFCARRIDSKWRPLLLRRLYPYLPDLQRQPAAYLHAFFHVSADDLASPLFSHLPRWARGRRLRLLLSDEMRASLDGYDGREEIASRLPADFGRWDAFCQSQYLEMALLLPGYILSSQGDRAAMAHAVEGRFPFLDPDVVELAAALPATLKMKGLDEKHLLRRLARDLVPEPLWRRSKQPYRAPDGASFFDDGRPDYVDELLSPARITRDGIFTSSAVDLLVRKFRERQPVGATDNMALVAVLSTGLLVDQFINTLGKAAHAGVRPGVAGLHPQ